MHVGVQLSPTLVPRKFAKHSFDNHMTLVLHPKARSASPTFYGNSTEQKHRDAVTRGVQGTPEKTQVSDSVRCQCGWEWVGQA